MSEIKTNKPGPLFSKDSDFAMSFNTQPVTRRLSLPFQQENKEENENRGRTEGKMTGASLSMQISRPPFQMSP